MVTDAYPANSIAWWFGARERGCHIPTLTYGMLGTLLPSSKLRRISIRPSFAMRLVSLIQSVKSSTPTIKVMMRCQTILIEIWLRQLERSRR